MWQRLIDRIMACGGGSTIYCLDWLALGQWIFDGGDCPVAEDFNADNALWLGWSLGGALILEAMSQKKLSPRQSIILSASPRFLQDAVTNWQAVPKKNWQALRKQVVRSPEAALAGFDSWLGLPAGYKRQLNVDTLQQGLDWLAAIDRRDWLASTAMPIHWVFGSDDPLLPTQSWTNSFCSACQQFTSLQGRGHALPWDQGDYLLNLLLTSSARGMVHV